MEEAGNIFIFCILGLLRHKESSLNVSGFQTEAEHIQDRSDGIYLSAPVLEPLDMILPVAFIQSILMPRMEKL